MAQRAALHDARLTHARIRRRRGSEQHAAHAGQDRGAVEVLGALGLLGGEGEAVETAHIESLLLGLDRRDDDGALGLGEQSARGSGLGLAAALFGRGLVVRRWHSGALGGEGEVGVDAAGAEDGDGGQVFLAAAALLGGFGEEALFVAAHAEAAG